jgi:hypothetical protein
MENKTDNDRWLKRLLVGGLLAFLLFVGVAGVATVAFSIGGMMMRDRAGQYYVPPPAAIAPEDDQPRSQAERGPRRIDPWYRYDMYGRGWGNNYGRGFSLFGFIGGIFRFLFTLFLIGLALVIVRRFWFGPRGGMSRWRNGGDAPAWVEDWHRKMHERMDASAAAASVATATPAPASAAELAASVAPTAPESQPDSGKPNEDTPATG